MPNDDLREILEGAAREWCYSVRGWGTRSPQFMVAQVWKATEKLEHVRKLLEAGGDCYELAKYYDPCTPRSMRVLASYDAAKQAALAAVRRKPRVIANIRTSMHSLT
jgi:hypothetical protein